MKQTSRTFIVCVLLLSVVTVAQASSISGGLAMGRWEEYDANNVLSISANGTGFYVAGSTRFPNTRVQLIGSYSRFSSDQATSTNPVQTVSMSSTATFSKAFVGYDLRQLPLTIGYGTVSQSIRVPGLSITSQGFGIAAYSDLALSDQMDLQAEVFLLPALARHINRAYLGSAAALSYDINASYRLSPSLVLEGGYRAVKTNHADEATHKVADFHLGAKHRF